MKLTNKKIIIFLALIVLLASVLRLWQLSSVPPSLDWDEASWGYNSYSILQTGKDEYGNFLPVVIRSFNDYKPALYAYLDLPVIKILGLNNFSVRFPNALFGILSVITAYFLVLEFFKRKDLALVTSFLLAISPWSIQFSRFSHEGILGLEFNLLMILFFLKGLKKPWLLCLSAAAGALSLYSYQNEKLFAPMLGLLLIIIFGKELLKLQKKYLITAFIFGLILSLPIIVFTFTNPNSFTRAKGASFLNRPVPIINNRLVDRIIVDKKNNDFVGLLFDNRRVVYAKEIAGNYLSHYDPNFLFITGDAIGRHQPPGMGHLYLLELPFFLIGLYLLIFGKFDRKIKILIFSWMLIVPIPAAFTWDVPNAGRTINFLPTFQILIAIGLVGAYFYLLRLNKSFRSLFYIAFAAIAIFNFSYYLNQYFVQYSYFNSQDFQYGYNQLIPIIKQNENKYKRIVVSNQIPLDQSYIFFLYNLKYPPEKYQKNSTGGAYKTTHIFEKYEFREVNKSESDSLTLYVVGSDMYFDTPDKKIIEKINFLDGKDAYVVYAGR